MFVNRDAQGKVREAFAVRQHPDQEELADAHPDLDALLRPPPPPAEHAINDRIGTTFSLLRFGEVIEELAGVLPPPTTPKLQALAQEIAAIKAEMAGGGGA